MAGSGVGVETSEATRWRESHRMRRSELIVTVDGNTDKHIFIMKDRTVHDKG